jgi:hypothetical protein
MMTRGPRGGKGRGGPTRSPAPGPRREALHAGEEGEEVDWGRATAYTDEALVVLAAMHAIQTGQQTVILTRDEDVMEQFYKLRWFLDTHYRGMLTADVYAREFSTFTTHKLADVGDVITDAFEIEGGLLFERTDEFLQRVLPARSTFVAMHCWLLREDERTQMIFGAEREMERLLFVKGKTGGLNTNLLNERNCHIWLAPLDVPRWAHGCGIIARDRRVALKGTDVALGALDVNQSIFTGERYKHATEDRAPGDAVLLDP